MFYRQKMYKLRKRKNVKVKESLEILEVRVFPITLTEKNKSRKTKKKESLQKQKNLNDKNARLYFFRKAQCNFDSSDYVWHITYSNDKRPQNIEEANKDFKNLIARVNSKRKKMGLSNAKYMAVIEGEEGNKKKIHFHIIIDGDIHRDMLEGFWKKGISNIDRLQLDENGVKSLTQYMTKDPKGKKRWKQSKGNLEEPIPSINDNRFTNRQMQNFLNNHPSREEFEKLYKGYTLTDYSIKYNDENGGVYMNISMRRIVKNEEHKKRE